MHRSIAPLIACLLLLTAGAASGDPLLLVVNKKVDRVDFYNANTFELLGSSKTGAGPHEVVVSPDKKFAYITDYEQIDNTISIIDIKGMKRVGKINVEPSYRPHGLAITRDGKHLFVTCEASRVVVDVELATKKVARTLFSNEMGTHMLVLSPDEKTIFTTNNKSHNVTVFNVESGEIRRHIRTGRSCDGIDISPDGNELWIANRNSESLSIIDAQTEKVVATVPCTGFPSRVKFAPDGNRVYVSCPTMGEITVFDRESRTVEKQIRTGQYPIEITVDPGGERVFVANTRDLTISVVNTTTLKVVKSYDVEETPDGMAYVE